MHNLLPVRDLLRILNLLKNARYRYLAYLFLSAGSIAAMAAINGIAYKHVINSLAALDYRRFITSAVVTCFGLLIPLVAVPVLSIKINEIYKPAIARLREDTYAHMLRLPSMYFGRTHSGEMLSILTSDLNLIEGVLQRQLYMVIESALIGGTALVVCFLLHWKLAVFSVLLGATTAFFSLLYVSIIRRYSDRVQTILGGLTQRIIDIRSNIRTIKLFDLYDFILDKFDRLNGTLFVERSKLACRESEIAAVNNAMTFLSQFLVLGIGIVMVNRGTADLGTIVGVVGLKLAIDDLFIKFGGFVVELQKALSGSVRFFEFADEEEDRFSERYIMCVSGDDVDKAVVSMEGVGFTYPVDSAGDGRCSEVLSRCDVTISANSTTAFIGPNGSGKSTIAKILLGLYPPSAGHVRYYLEKESAESTAGVAHNGATEQISRFFSYVPQEPVIFRGTVALNIAFCDFSGIPDHERFIEVSRAAGVHEFVQDLPDGYDTVLAEEGCNLSGGQRQRINIARALYHDRPLYVFDEATSALDVVTEERLNRVIEDIASRRTVIVVAHRPAIIQRAATVYRLDRGKTDLIRRQ